MHAQQTESSTPVREVNDMATHLSYFNRMRDKKQPSFILIAQDITAPLMIDFWIKVQQKVQALVLQGHHEIEAVRMVRAYYFLDDHVVPLVDLKLSQACEIAGAMEKFPHRKLAD